MPFPALDLSSLTERISDLQLEALCRHNPDARLETDAQGKLIIMSPTESERGKRNGSLFLQVGIWNNRTKLGVVFDFSFNYGEKLNSQPKISKRKKIA